MFRYFISELIWPLTVFHIAIAIAIVIITFFFFLSTLFWPYGQVRGIPVEFSKKFKCNNCCFLPVCVLVRVSWLLVEPKPGADKKRNEKPNGHESKLTRAPATMDEKRKKSLKHENTQESTTNWW